MWTYVTCMWEELDLKLDLQELESHAAVSPVIGCWKPNVGPLEKQQMLLKAKPSLSAPEIFQ